MNLNAIRTVAVFCGSGSGKSKQYCLAVEELADVLTEYGIQLIYGGAEVGLMGAIANRMLKQSGHVIGVIPQSLVDVEIAHKHLSEIHIVKSMHERKALMADLADGFILLPGGAGSLDEFFEIFTWAQLGYHAKPCGILNVGGYYDFILKFLDHAVAEGFMNSVYRNMIIVDPSPKVLIQGFINYQPPVDIKWKKSVVEKV